MSAVDVRAVTLDATGTLIHSPRLGEIYSEVLARHGYRVGSEQARQLCAKVWQELSVATGSGGDRFTGHPDGATGWWLSFLERFCVHLEVDPPSRFAAAELFDRFGRAPAWELFADVVPALERLRRRGLRMAVVANWDERLPRLLAQLGLESYFETVVTSQGAGVEKPHPVIFQTALSLLDLPPEAVLHVGDRRLEDFEGAEALGMPALLLDRGGGGDIDSLERVLEEPKLESSC